MASNARNSASRYLFGDDIFISYSRRDGLGYALGLATSLEGLRCYVDQFGSIPSERLPELIRRRLDRCTVFVLVGTPEATRSDAVREEVERFIGTGRPIVPISFENAIEQSRLGRLLVGLPITPESPQALHAAAPSPAVTSRIQASLSYTRHALRMRRLVTAAISAFATVGVGTAGYQVAMDYAARKNEICRLATSGLDSHLDAQEFRATWPDSWEQVRAEKEAEVKQACGEARG